jgi:hypothetical protein
MMDAKKIYIVKNGTGIGGRLQFEKMISDLSARLINLPSEKLDSEIENALKMILEFFQVDRCALIGSLGWQQWSKFGWFRSVLKTQAIPLALRRILASMIPGTAP